MRKLLVTSTLLMLTFGPAAIAQSGNSTGNKEPLPAPIGHRQPRADQVPSGRSAASDAERKADAELDRKIKSICRGC
jgi:hypothetical protein